MTSTAAPVCGTFALQAQTPLFERGVYCAAASLGITQVRLHPEGATKCLPPPFPTILSLAHRFLLP